MVHIHWKGKGWAVALVTFACCLTSELVSEAITNDDTFYQNSAYPITIAMVASTAFTFLVVDKLKNSKSDYVPSNHTLFFIPIDYWRWILLTISSLMVIFRILLVSKPK